MNEDEKRKFGLLEEIANRTGIPYGYNERKPHTDPIQYHPEEGTANFIPPKEFTHGKNIPHMEYRPKENAVVISRMGRSDYEALAGRLIARELVTKHSAGTPMTVVVNSEQDMRKLGEELDRIYSPPAVAKKR